MSASVPSTLLPRYFHSMRWEVVRLSKRTCHDPTDHSTDTPRSQHEVMDEQAYDNRVRAIEDELGIPTSDAQAMVNAEDVLAQRRS